MKKHLAQIVFLFLFVALFVVIRYEKVIPQDKTTNSCIAQGCHSDMTKNKYKHSPAFEDCGTCHTKSGNKHPEDTGKEFALSAKVPDLCTQCHEIKKDGKSMHSPVNDGECMTCHNPHSSNQKNLLNLTDGKVICLSCHDNIKQDSVVHGPVRQDNCISCHNGHSSKIKKLLKDEEPKLCFSCHNKTIKTKSYTIPNIKEKSNRKYVHAPITANGCSDCHLPHTSKFNGLLKIPFSDKNYVSSKAESFKLCFQCHDEKLITSEKTDNATGFRNGQTNLHNLHIMKGKGRNCSMCHDMHGSSNEKMINERVKFGTWDFDMNFKKNENGGSCSPACHKTLTYNTKSIPKKEDIAVNLNPAETKGLTDKAVQSLPDKPAQQKLKNSNQRKIEKRKIPKGVLYATLTNLEGINKKLLPGIEMHVQSVDSTYDESVALDKNLKFTLKDIPYGEYFAWIDEDDLESLSADVPVKTKSFKIDTSSTEILSVSIDFDIHRKKEIASVIPIQPPPKPKPKIKPNTVKTYYYDSNKDPEIKTELKSYINDVVKYLKKHPKAQVVIITHTDNTGTTDEQKKLADNVNEKLIRLLVEKGISKMRILTQSKGSLEPAAPNLSATGKSKNRRVELKILK